jgi:hypothetical protein
MARSNLFPTLKLLIAFSLLRRPGRIWLGAGRLWRLAAFGLVLLRTMKILSSILLQSAWKTGHNCEPIVRSKGQAKTHAIVLRPESHPLVSLYSGFRALRRCPGGPTALSTGHCTEIETVSPASCTLQAQATRTRRPPPAAGGTAKLPASCATIGLLIELPRREDYELLPNLWNRLA